MQTLDKNTIFWKTITRFLVTDFILIYKCRVTEQHLRAGDSNKTQDIRQQNDSLEQKTTTKILGNNTILQLRSSWFWYNGTLIHLPTVNVIPPVKPTDVFN